MPGSDCRLKLLLVVTVLCLYCMISTLISVTRHQPTSQPEPGQMTNVYFIVMLAIVFPPELQTKVHTKVRNHGEGPYTRALSWLKIATTDVTFKTLC